MGFWEKVGKSSMNGGWESAVGSLAVGSLAVGSGQWGSLAVGSLGSRQSGQWAVG